MTRTTTQCLEAATRIECMAQEMYTGLAVTYQDQPYLRELFLRLAAEEGQHAMRIRLLERQRGKAAWPRQMLDRVCDDLDAMAQEMAAMRASFRRLSPAADARPALRRLAEMEVRFGSIHAEELARSALPEIQALFEGLAQQDARHRTFIQNALGTLAA
jgi:rubrerythrin